MMARAKPSGFVCNCCGGPVFEGRCKYADCDSHEFAETSSRQALRHRVQAALPGVVADIAKRSFVSRSTTQSWLRVLYNANECHMAGVRINGGRPAVVYAPGPTRKPK